MGYSKLDEGNQTLRVLPAAGAAKNGGKKRTLWLGGLMEACSNLRLFLPLTRWLVFALQPQDAKR